MYPGRSPLVILEGRNQTPWEGGGFLETRPGHDDEIAEGEEVLKILPGLNLHKSISSYNKVQGVLELLPEISEGINGIGFPRPFKFNIRHGKTRVFLNGQFHHLEAMASLNDLFLHFMGRQSSGNEDHFLKVEGLSNLFRSSEVT